MGYYCQNKVTGNAMKKLFFTIIFSQILLIGAFAKVDVVEKVALGESHLVGINLFDLGTQVTKKYGSPNSIESADAKKEDESAESEESEEETEQKKTYNTRWVYSLKQSKYSFIIDKHGRVIQIEVLGLSDSKVVTRKKVTLGDDFAKISRCYGSPEYYKLSNNQVIVSYMNKHRVLFRLTKTKENKPHKIVGIVVSAGKS